MKIIIFGIGLYTDAILNIIRSDVEIVCCIDNDANKHGSEYGGVKIVPVDEGIKKEFDYVVFGFTVGYDKAIEQLSKFDVNNEKIVIPYKFDHSQYRKYRNLFYMEELIYLETDYRLRKIEARLDNLPYELFDMFSDGSLWIPHIMNWENTINEIIDQGKSISRFGDGEFDLILGRGCSLQNNNTRLASQLKDVLKTDCEYLMIGIPDVFGSLNGKDEDFKEVFRRNLTGGGRECIYTLLNRNKVYYDSFVTRPYKNYMDKVQAKRHFELIKQIWKNRNITIIEGAQSRLGVGNDLFSNAGSIERIICPVVNAFDKYDEILSAAQNISKDRLVLIALGPTATVLARDLAVCGYQAIDIGHIDVEYEWFLRGEITAIEGKYVNEAPMGRIVRDDNLPSLYYKQIVAQILND